eukprot:30611-Pyramimonas_sp.AAC.1
MKAAWQGAHLRVASHELGSEAGANVDLSVAWQVRHRGSLPELFGPGGNCSGQDMRRPRSLRTAARPIAYRAACTTAPLRPR